MENVNNFQDANQYIEHDAKKILKAIEKISEKDSAEIEMLINIDGEELAIGLWSTDVCAILTDAFEKIKIFAKSNYTK
jgi:hypothetical protein